MSGSDLSLAVAPGSRVWRWEPLLFWSLAMLALLPLWLPAFPPMADLPQHAAQVALFRDLWADVPRWGGLLEIKWFTPYILGYALTIALAQVFGVVAACKIMASMALLLTLGVTRYLLRWSRSNAALAWLCFFGLYGFVYQWGLISFMLAVPAGLYGIRVLAWHQERPDSLRGWVLSAYFVGVFFGHALVLAFCFAVAGVYWLSLAPTQQGARAMLAWAWGRLWPLLPVGILAYLWLARSSGHASVATPVEWDLGWWQTTEAYYSSARWAYLHSAGWGRVSGLFPRALGLRSELIANAIGLVLLALPFLLGYRIKVCRVGLAPFVALVFVLLLVPSFVFGTAFVFQRYAMFFLPLYVLLFGVSPRVEIGAFRQRCLAATVLIGGMFWIGMFAVRAADFDRGAKNFLAVTDQAEPGNRVLSLVFFEDDEDSIAPTLLHFPTWMSATKGSLVDAGFTGTHIQLVAYKQGMLPKASVVEHFEWQPETFNWKRHHGDQYRYFVIRSRTDVSSLLFSGAPCAPRLVSSNQDWWLYVRVEQCAM